MNALQSAGHETKLNRVPKSKVRASIQALAAAPGDASEAHYIDLVAAAFPTLPAKYQAYIAGIMHPWGKGAIQDLGDEFVDVSVWDDDALAALFERAACASNDASFHLCYGMLWDFTDEAREDLLKRFGVHEFRSWTPAMTNELWAEAKKLRASNPEMLDPERSAPRAGSCLDIYTHPLRIDSRESPANMVGCNVNLKPTPGATLDDALNDVAGYLTSAVSILTNDGAVSLNETGWAAVHLLCLAKAIHGSIHSTLMHLPRPGVAAA